MAKKKYRFINEYFLRVPLLSFEEFQSLDEYEIRKLISRKEVVEAIYLASPSFYDELEKALTETSFDNKMLVSLYKYITRMSFRCTPFGLFSGCDIGAFSNEKSNIQLYNHSDYSRKSRYDMNFLCSLAKQIDRSKDVRKVLTYYPNSSLTKIGNDFRFIEYSYLNSKRKHFLSSVESDIYLNEIVLKSKKGKSFEEIVEILISIDQGINYDEARGYVNELIDSQVLVSSLSPSVTGEDYLERIIKQINEVEGFGWIRLLKDKLNQIDRNTFNPDLSPYFNLHNQLDFLKIKYDKKYLIQTDLIVKSHFNNINYNILKSIRKGLTVLNKLKYKTRNSSLDYFKRKFIERYNDELVPLSLVLDIENGIGFSNNNHDSDHYDISTLTEGLEFSYTEESTSNLSPARNLLRGLILRVLEKGERELVLTDELLKEFDEDWNDFPITMSGMVKILDNSENPKIFMDLFAGSTASLLLGRFGHVHEKFYSLIEQIFEIEKRNSGFINAEIAHLPQDRIGNIVIRKNQRDYEIPYLSFSTLPDEAQLNINDLYVTIEGDRVVLFSKKLNREILPFNSNANFFSTPDSMPIYNFLGSLQVQNLYGFLALDFGETEYRFVPRISYQNIIFSPARWTIDSKEIKEIITQTESWITKNSIPRYIVLSEEDNDLLIDLRNELSVQVFKSIIKRKRKIEIKEFLFDEKQFLVSDEKGKGYFNEVIISIEIK